MRRDGAKSPLILIPPNPTTTTGAERPVTGSDSPIALASKYKDLIDKYKKDNKTDVYEIFEIAAACNNVEELISQYMKDTVKVEEEFLKNPDTLSLNDFKTIAEHAVIVRRNIIENSDDKGFTSIAEFAEIGRSEEIKISDEEKKISDDAARIVSVVVESYLTDPNCKLKQAAEEFKNQQELDEDSSDEFFPITASGNSLGNSLFSTVGIFPMDSDEEEEDPLPGGEPPSCNA